MHSDLFKNTELLLQNNILKTDQAFFSSYYKNLQFTKLIEQQTDVMKIYENTKEVAQINIYSSNRSEVYYRKYVKVSDIIASFGGQIKVFMVIFSLLIKPFIFNKKFKSIFKHCLWE